MEAYNTNTPLPNLMKEITSIFTQVHNSKNKYVVHSLKKYKNIPTWIMIKAISFSNLINIISYSKVEVKNSICKIYGLKSTKKEYDHKFLISSLHWFRIVRNSCAHNERIYNISSNNGRIHCSFFGNLSKSYTRNYYDQKLIDFIVYIKYYLDNDEYSNFINEMKKILFSLKSNVPPIVFDYIKKEMGIKNIEDLNVLDGIKHDIDLSDF